MNYKEFKPAVKRCKAKHPVILLEGKRTVLPEERERLISRSSRLEGASGADFLDKCAILVLKRTTLQALRKGAD